MPIDDFPYNKGAITRQGFEPGAYGRVHNFLWLLRRMLSADSVLLCAWADAQNPQWIPRVDFIQRTFGWDDKQWRRVREQLESIGVITSTHEKSLPSQKSKSVHTLNIDLTVLAALVDELELEPPARNGGSHARIAKNGGSRESPEMAGSREPPEMEGLTTTSETRQKNHHHARARRARTPVGGGSGEDEDGQQVRSALAPAGAGLGARLADLLAQPECVRVDNASAGASDEQLQRAAAALRAAVAAGTVRSVAALAVALGRKAARGEVGEVATGSPTPAAVQPNPWPARERYAGLTVAHQLGTLVVQPGARQFQHFDGARAGQLVGGADAAKVWDRIDRGELALQPPTPP